jgi:hypothetical protein
MSVRELLLLLGWFITTIHGENLRPPYLNLAREKHITVSATSTCGEFPDKQNPNKIKYKKELYCKLTGSSPYEKDYKDSNLIYGQYCDSCDSSVPDKKHIVNYTIDGTDRWWQVKIIKNKNAKFQIFVYSHHHYHAVLNIKR